MDTQLNRNILLRSGGWALTGTVLTLILGLTVNILLTRLLPAADVGCYFLLVSFVAFSTILAQAGILQVLLRRVALSPMIKGRFGAANEVKAACVYVGIGVIFVGCLHVFFFDFWVDKFTPSRPELTSIVFLILVWTGVLAYQGIVTESFRGFHNIRNAVLFGGILTNAMLVTVLGVLYGYGAKPALRDVVLLVVGLALLSLVIGFGILSGKITAVQRGDHLHQLKSMFQEATPLLLSGLLMLVISQGDLWIIGFYLGNEDTAIYGVAAKLAVLAGMPLNLLNAILPPHISQLHAANKLMELEKLLRISAGIASIPAILMALGAILFGKELLGFLYGDHFRQAGPILGVLCVGQLGHVLLGPSGLVLMLTGRGKALMVITFFSCLFLVVVGSIAASHGVLWVGLVAAITLVIQKMLMCKVANYGLGIHTHARFDRDFFRIFRMLIRH